MAKPNRNLDLAETNYFRNLKKRATNEFDNGVLDCIKLLEIRIKHLEGVVVGLAESHNGAIESIGEAINTLSDNVKELTDIVKEGGETMDA